VQASRTRFIKTLFYINNRETEPDLVVCLIHIWLVLFYRCRKKTQIYLPHATISQQPRIINVRDLKGESMEYEIKGSTMQSLDIVLSAGEAVYAESGGMAWMRGDVEIKTNTRGGLLSGIGRALAGESLFMTTYSVNQGGATITFAPEAPGKIMPVRLPAGLSLICQKDAFMCAEDSVTLEMYFRKSLGAGLFGGEGFILQKITGPGMAFLEIPGEVREIQLAAHEKVKVDPGYLAAYEPTVKFDVTMVKGIKNVVFGGEGLFLSVLEGPGRVWLQTLPLANLARKLSRYIPRGN
jgi:uncharacterized protein (TIGR00266 family)